MRAAFTCVILLTLAGCHDILDIEISPPASSVPGLVVCDPVAQTECPDGARCAFVLADPPTGFGTFGCVPAGGGAEGQPCTEPNGPMASDNCGAGLHCVLGTCLEICDEQTACARGDCVPLGEKAEVGVFFNVCSEVCSAFAHDCSALSCFFDVDDGAMCLLPGPNGKGAGCLRSTDCADGLGCHEDPFGNKLCLTYCDQPMCTDAAGAPSACGCGNCDVDEVCVDFFEPELQGRGQGVCLPASSVGCSCDTPPSCDSMF
jgi:hypothetical protein